MAKAQAVERLAQLQEDFSRALWTAEMLAEETGSEEFLELSEYVVTLVDLWKYARNRLSDWPRLQKLVERRGLELKEAADTPAEPAEGKAKKKGKG